MQVNFTRHTRINRLAASALLILCFVQTQVRAQGFHNPDSFQIISAGNIGLTRGQTLRYTWANLNDPDPQQRELEPLRIEVKLRAADGSIIAQAAAPAVGAGQFQSFNFHRDQINLPGEPGTDRLQVRLEVTVELRRRNLVTILSMDVDFADAVEVIDTLTGRTTVSSKPKEIVVVGSKIRED